MTTYKNTDIGVKGRVVILENLRFSIQVATQKENSPKIPPILGRFYLER